MAINTNIVTKFTMSYRRNETNVDFDDRCIQDFIRHWSGVKPKEDAFVFVSVDGKREVVSWRDLHDNAIGYAQAFLHLELQQRSVVGISMRANPQCLYLHFGAIFAGLIPIDVVFSAKDCKDVVALINKIEQCYVFIIDPDQNESTWSVFRSFFQSVDIQGFALSEEIPNLKYFIPTSLPSKEQNYFTLDDMLHLARQKAPMKLPSVDPSSTAVLIQTSGSTGTPKAVEHTHNAVIHRAIDEDSKLRVYRNRIFYWGSCWPRNVVSGQTWISPSKFTEPSQCTSAFIMRVAGQELCSQVFVHPYQVEDFLETLKVGLKPSCTFSVITTGHHASSNVARCVGVLTSSFTNMYGSTEAMAVLQVTTKPGDKFEDGCCGLPLKGVEVKIVDENERVVPVNTRGQLLIRSKTMFKGYYKDPEKTSSVFTPDGWYRSDDIARMTEDGILFIDGRRSDVIICRGKNIWPASIENILLKCPGVKHAMVVPVPHETFYQEVCACIVAESHSDLTEATVRQFCVDSFVDKEGNFIILPEYFLFFETFPKNQTGKFSRKSIRLEASDRIRNKKQK